MVNFGPLAAEIVSLVWGTAANFNGFRVLAALLHGTLLVGVSETAALNRGCHLYSVGRPSRWALAHISSFFYVLSSIFFIPRLISAVADWMSTILLHMVWPECEFRMQVWNVLHAARWKYRTQKWCTKSLSAHHRTTLLGYIFATKACMDNLEKNLLSSNISSTCPYNMANFGPLATRLFR